MIIKICQRKYLTLPSIKQNNNLEKKMHYFPNFKLLKQTIISIICRKLFSLHSEYFSNFKKQTYVEHYLIYV